ncbi:MAG: hypothetical protein ABSA97_03140 [Verrucomicrobiia bacterium]
MFHSSLGFHAIGTGETLARASLMGNLELTAPLTDVIYRLTEAKFMGESALGVGKKTVILTLGQDGEWDAVLPKDAEKIRELWDKTGRPPIPAKAQDTINGIKRRLNWALPTHPKAKRASSES